MLCGGTWRSTTCNNLSTVGDKRLSLKSVRTCVCVFIGAQVWAWIWAHFYTALRAALKVELNHQHDHLTPAVHNLHHQTACCYYHCTCPPASCNGSQTVLTVLARTQGGGELIVFLHAFKMVCFITRAERTGWRCVNSGKKVFAASGCTRKVWGTGVCPTQTASSTNGHRFTLEIDHHKYSLCYRSVT